ncbi:MAG: DUF4366 domain-containing protein [Firmicutes bacterium]|nr:DUF4366 domain-containing protein [Bacillota bacterium]
MPTDTSVIPETIQPVKEDPEHPEAPESEEPVKQSSNRGFMIFLVIAFIGSGGVAYYFKIVKGKKNADEDDMDDGFGDEDEDSDDDEYGFEDELEDDGDDHDNKR